MGVGDVRMYVCVLRVYYVYIMCVLCVYVCMYMCVSAMAFAGTTITKATFAYLQHAKNRRAPYALELDAIGRGHDGGQSIKFTRKFSD